MSDMYEALEDLLDRWNNEAAELMNTPGYENHSRGCLTKTHIREVQSLLFIARAESNA